LNRCAGLRIFPPRLSVLEAPSLWPGVRHLMRIPYRILSLNVLMVSTVVSALWAGKVTVYPAKNIDINAYKIYEWLPARVMTKVGVIEDHPANPVLKEAVGRQLSQRGLREVAADPDLQIQVWVLTESVPQLEAVIVAAVVVDVGTYMTIGDPVASIGRYNRQGSLYLNLIDRRTNKSAWFAMVTDSLPSNALEPDKLRAKLDKAATDIFKKYPVKKK
jgi:Domain of unknown function (DUF4136)